MIRRRFKRYLSCLLTICIIASVIPFSAGSEAVAAVKEDWTILGPLSARFESNGNPGAISNGKGDKGGKSYGAYQFDSAYNGPLTFAKWCVSSKNNADIGNQLVNAYKKDKGFGTNFDST